MDRNTLLSIRLFGGCEVILGGRMVPLLATQKSVLTALILGTDLAEDEEDAAEMATMAEWLWGERTNNRSRAQGKNSYSRALSDLKTRLGAVRKPSNQDSGFAAEDVVEIEGKCVMSFQNQDKFKVVLKFPEREQIYLDYDFIKEMQSKFDGEAWGRSGREFSANSLFPGRDTEWVKEKRVLFRNIIDGFDRAILEHSKTLELSTEPSENNALGVFVLAPANPTETRPLSFQDQALLNEWARFTREYYQMPQWDRFPVTAFSGKTSLEDAAAPNVISEVEFASEPFTPSPSLPQKGTVGFPSETRTVRQVETVGEALESLRRNQKQPHILILGEAGDGKSTLLRLLGKRYCEQGLYPVLISARQWEDSNRTLREFVRRRYFAGEESEVLKSGGDFLWERILKGEAPLLVDGLDEALHPEALGEKLDKLCRLVRGQEDRDVTVIVTTRPEKYRNALPGYAEVELCTLDFEEHVRPYAQARLGKHANRFLEHLSSNPPTKALAGNGLMLAMLCSEWESRGYNEGSSATLSSGREDLYASIIGQLLLPPGEVGRKERANYVPYKTDLKLEILASVAFHAHFCHKRTKEIPEGLVLKALREVAEANPGVSFDWDEKKAILDDIVLNSELLSRDASGRNYGFFHASFSEWFCALYLVNHWDDPHWSRWLPTKRLWPIYHPHVVELLNVEPTPEEAAEIIDGIECPVCEKRLAPFFDVLCIPDHQEVFLVMTGMLGDYEREEAFLSGLIEICPMIKAYSLVESTKETIFLVSFDAESATGELFENILRCGCYIDGVFDADTEPEILDHRALLADIQDWQALALRIISCCSGHHPDAAKVAIFAYLTTLCNEPDFDIFRAFGEARNKENVLTAVDALIDAISNPPFLDSNEAEKLLEKIIPGQFETLNELPLSMCNLTRAGFAGILAAIGGEKAETFLLQVAEDPNEDTLFQRFGMTGAITSGGSPSIWNSVLSPLRDLLADRDASDYQRHQAAEKLSKIGGPVATSLISEAALDQENSEELRVNVMASSMNLPLSDQLDLLKDLRELFEDGEDSSRVRGFAIHVFGVTLASYKGPLDREMEGGIATLNALAGDVNEAEFLRIKSFSALECIYSRHPVKRESLDMMMAVLENAADEIAFRRLAAQGLAIIADVSAIPSLERVFRHGDEDARLLNLVEWALDRIAKVRESKPILQTVEDPKVSRQAKAEARESMERAVKEVILNCLDILGANGTGRRQPPFVTEGLGIIVKDAPLDLSKSGALGASSDDPESEFDVRQAIYATQILGSMLKDAPEVASKLGVLDAFRDSLSDRNSSYELKQAIIWALPQPAETSFSRLFLRELKNSDNPVTIRQAACWALSNQETQKPFEPVRRELIDKDNPPALRRTAAIMLNKLDSKKARPVLERIACDGGEEPILRGECVVQLMKTRAQTRRNSS